ncbi:MAG: hemolysin family protein [bacterium]
MAILLWLVVIVSVVAVGFFAGSETALVSCSRYRVKALVRRKQRRLSRALITLDNRAMSLSVILIGNNIFVVLSSALTTNLLEQRFGGYSVLISTVAVTVVLLIFGEIIPKTVASRNPDGFLLRTLGGLLIAYYVLYPFGLVWAGLGKILSRFLGGREWHIIGSREEIGILTREAMESSLALTPFSGAHRVLDLSRITVGSIMKPMDEVECIDEGSTVEEAKEVATQTGYSRYPICRGTKDNIVGILNIKSLLGIPGKASIRSFVRSPFFVPEIQTLKTAMGEMHEEVKHLAIVADEYGRPVGIITFEDLIEEVIGEVSDEFDLGLPDKVTIGKPIPGNTPILLLNEILDINIPEGGYQTVAGFILDRLGRMCHPGDSVEFDGYRIEVLEMKGRRIKTVKISKAEGDE